MQQTVTLQAMYQGIVQEQSPNRTYVQGYSYGVVGGKAGEQARTLLWFTSPFGAGRRVNIVKAEIILTMRSASTTGGHTVKVARNSNAWQGKITASTWNNKPVAITQDEATATWSGTVSSGSKVRFDVTAGMQATANGQPWHGVQVYAPGVERLVFEGAYGSAATRPQLVVTWTDNPLPPTNLSPTGNISVAQPTYRWSGVDFVGQTSIQRAELRVGGVTYSIPTTNADITPADFKAAGLTAPTFADGTGSPWRVRWQDTSGLWSDWSTWTSFVYYKVGTLELRSPTTTWTDDPTPVVDWVYTPAGGRPQARWKVVIRDNLTHRPIEDTGYRDGAYGSYTCTKPWVAGRPYDVEVYVQDGITRTALPEGSPVAAVLHEAKYSPNTDYDITDVRADYDRVTGEMVLRFKRAITPDQWQLVRDDQLIETQYGVAGDPKSGFVLRTERAPAGWHKWAVRAVVNKKVVESASVVAHADTVGSWLIPTDGSSRGMFFAGQGDSTVALAEVNTVHTPLGARETVVITSAQRGWEGHVKATLATREGYPYEQNARVGQQLLAAWRDDIGRTFWLLIDDLEVKVCIYNVTWRSRPDRGGGYAYDVEFDYHEVA